MARQQTVSPKSPNPAQTPVASQAVLWLCLLLAASIVAAFHPVLSHDFINFDDPDYVTDNAQVKQGVTWEGIKWAFNAGQASNWHPLTWLSHMLDVSLFGMKPAGHHATSLLFHVANSVLLLLWLRWMTGSLWRSAFVAALFALHPLHVESVAWLSERKDVLSTFFGLLSLLAYARYSRSAILHPPSSIRANFKSPMYGLTGLFLALGLMSKPMLVTWPFVMLLLDFWPLKRFALSTFKRLVAEKLPFLALSVGSSVMTFIAQKEGGAIANLTALAFWPRIQNALLAYATYLQKMFWPTNLASYYPFPESLPAGEVTLAFCVLAGLSALAFRWYRQRPYFLVGWLWYLGMLVPVIGIVQVGYQALADRYTYLPLVGVFILITWGGEEMTRDWPRRRTLLSAVALVVLAACGLLTSVQAGYWKNSETLHRHTLAVTTRNATVHVNLGSALIFQGRMAEAAEQFTEALQIRPAYAEARSNLGFALAEQGRYEEAIVQYRLALQIKPHGKTGFLLGNVLNTQGKTAEAIAEYRRALEIDPNQLGALNDLTWLLATHPDPKFRNGAEAVQLGERANKILGRREPMFLGTLAAAYAEAGRFEEATRTGEAARDLAERNGLKELAARNAQLVGQYRSGKPHREPATPPTR